jgi:hypothetical protein
LKVMRLGAARVWEGRRKQRQRPPFSAGYAVNGGSQFPILWGMGEIYCTQQALPWH